MTDMETFRLAPRASFLAKGGPVSLANTQCVDLQAAHGDIYRLLISVPQEAPPPGGFPVIYAVDGNALFAILAEAARLQARRPEVTGVRPSVIVGIGYPDMKAFDEKRRVKDLLPDVGADLFLDFIRDYVMTFVESLTAVDARGRSLIGHSFGGLFALHTLFTRTDLFRSYIAGSPSIWWNDRAILAAEQQFRAGGDDNIDVRLLVTVGGAEQAAGGQHSPEREARLRMACMIGDTESLVERLNGVRRVTCEHVCFAEENHMSVIPAMLTRAVRFALSDETSAAR